MDTPDIQHPVPGGPVPQRRTQSAHDADDHAHNLSGWDQRYDQFSQGRFEGRMTQLWLPGLQVFRESANRVLHQSCAARAGTLWFGLPTPRTVMPSFDAQAVARHSLLCRRGGQQFDLSTPENYDLFGIVVDRTLLDGHMMFPEDDAPGLFGGSGALQVPPHLYGQLMAVLQGVLFGPGGLDSQPDALQLDGTRRGVSNVQESVLDALDAVLASATATSPGSAASRVRHGWRLVARARAQVLDHPGEPLSVADLCRRLNVSRRALQYCFQAVVGMSPLSYLRTLRLNQVRRGLHGMDGGRACVTRVATAWGFDHLGQFSADYRRLFGELPSRTLRAAAASHRADF